MGHEPDALRRRVAELTREAAGGAIGLWYVFGMIDGEPYPIDWKADHGVEPIFWRWLHERLQWPAGDPRMPDRRTLGRFVTIGSIFASRMLAETTFYQRCIVPMGVTDQVRMMVYFRGRHVGWIGAMRTGGDRPFGDRDLRRLRRVSASIRSALVHAEALSNAASPQEACDLVLDTQGRVELASVSAAPILEHPEREPMLAQWVRDVERGREPLRVLAGMSVHWSRLSGSMGSRYLLHLEPAEAVTLLPAVGLSRTQRAVAEYAAAGAHVREIAEVLGVAPTTVRTHLRAVYTTLEVANRAELARALRGHELATAAEHGSNARQDRQ